jgi:hypothetical protein
MMPKRVWRTLIPINIARGHGRDANPGGPISPSVHQLAAGNGLFTLI